MTSVHSKGSKPKVNFGKVWTACLSTLNLGYYNGCWYFKHFHQVCECISLLSENIFLSKLKRYFDGRPLNSGKSVAKLAADAGGLPSLSPPSLSPAQNCISATIMNDLGIYFYLNWKHISKSVAGLPFLLHCLFSCPIDFDDWKPEELMSTQSIEWGQSHE